MAPVGSTAREAPVRLKTRGCGVPVAVVQGEEAAGELRGLRPRPHGRAEPAEEAQAAGGGAGGARARDSGERPLPARTLGGAGMDGPQRRTERSFVLVRFPEAYGAYEPSFQTRKEKVGM